MTDPTTRSSRIWWILGLGCVAAWCVYLVAFGPRGPGGGDFGSPRLAAPERELRTDYQWTLRDLDDAPVDFARFRGKTIFLNIWATWCPPCRAEMPSIANLADDGRLKDVVFLCVSVDNSAEPVRALVRDKHWAMTILRATKLPDAFSTEVIPATFVIAPDGRVVASEVGAAQWDHPSVVRFLKRVETDAAVDEEIRGNKSAKPRT